MVKEHFGEEAIIVSSQKAETGLGVEVTAAVDSETELPTKLNDDISNSSTAEDIQTLLYEVGKKHKFENLKEFFKLVYQVLLGQEKGPRLGSFIKLYGINETINSIKTKLNN